jgi:hypothetical protein
MEGMRDGLHGKVCVSAFHAYFDFRVDVKNRYVVTQHFVLRTKVRDCA